MGTRASTKEILDEVISRIVSVLDSDKIILFRTGAREKWDQIATLTCWW